MLATLGRTDDPRRASQLGSLITTARRYTEEQPLVVNEGTPVATKTWGPHLVWGRLWEETLGPILNETLFPGFQNGWPRPST